MGIGFLRRTRDADTPVPAERLPPLHVGWACPALVEPENSEVMLVAAHKRLG